MQSPCQPHCAARSTMFSQGITKPAAQVLTSPYTSQPLPLMSHCSSIQLGTFLHCPFHAFHPVSMDPRASSTFPFLSGPNPSSTEWDLIPCPEDTPSKSLQTCPTEPRVRRDRKPSFPKYDPGNDGKLGHSDCTLWSQPHFYLLGRQHHIKVIDLGRRWQTFSIKGRL